jgi:hypothetical protein
MPCPSRAKLPEDSAHAIELIMTFVGGDCKEEGGIFGLLEGFGSKGDVSEANDRAKGLTVPGVTVGVEEVSERVEYADSGSCS